MIEKCLCFHIGITRVLGTEDSSIKEGLRSRSATPLCFHGKVVQDQEAKSHRSVLPCVDRKRVFFGSESRQFTVRHQPPCSCGLVTMLEGPVACDVIFSTSQTPTRLICCTNSCATKYPLLLVYFFSAGPSQIGGSRRRMQWWFESAEGNRAQISPAGKTERQAQQGLRIRGPFYGLLCSLQRVPFKELLHSCIWFQPTPVNKTCVASDGKSRSEIRRGKLALSWIARAIHHWTIISMNYLRKTRRRGNKGHALNLLRHNQCTVRLSDQNNRQRFFCGPNIMLSSLWVCFIYTVYKWRRVRSANILLYGNRMINWTVYKL